MLLLIITLLAFWGLLDNIKSFYRQKVILKNAFEMEEFYVELKDNKAVLFSLISAVGNILLVIATTLFNPFFVAVPNFVLISTLVIAITFHILAIIIIAIYGEKSS